MAVEGDGKAAATMADLTELRDSLTSAMETNTATTNSSLDEIREMLHALGKKKPRSAKAKPPLEEGIVLEGELEASPSDNNSGDEESSS